MLAKRVVCLNLALVIFSAAFTLFAVEAAYRTMLVVQGDFFIKKLRVTPEPHGIYSEEFGMEYIPNSKMHFLNVNQEGIPTWCPNGPLSITNEDGLNGQTTYSDYQNAQYKIAVFGDSFTHWNQSGNTWPDLLQSQLSIASNTDTAVLNFARGGYGILQMLDLAGSVTQKIQPDLTIIAFITNDLTRDRWWSIDEVVEGYRRSFLSPTTKEYFTVENSTDRWIIEPNATLEWCRDRVDDPDHHDDVRNAVADKIDRLMSNADYNNPFSIRTSYVYNKIVYGTPFGGGLRPHIPRHNYDTFLEDSKFVAAVKNTIKNSSNILLLHIPSKKQIETKRYYGENRERVLFESIESALSNKIIYLGDLIEQEHVPQKIDLLPHDGHPNLEGLELYANTLTDHLLNSGFVRNN